MTSIPIKEIQIPVIKETGFTL